jgi:MFS family permease
LVVAVAALVVWFPYEMRVSQPLVDLRTSARRPVLLTNIASLLVGFAMFANLLLTTQQLQLPTSTGYGFGFSVVAAGLAMVPGGIAMVLFAPISGRMINLYGGRITLITGAALMGTAYLMRVYFSSTALVVIALSMLVAIGTAITYAAMPTLIMASVPITETASANGLNSLLRAIGTSTSSAAVTAVLASVTIQIGSATVPSFSAFQEIYWMTGISALTACAVAWYIPARKRAGAVAASGSSAAPRSVTEAGEDSEIVVRGSILQFENRPVHPAVITVMKTDGTPVDWSRADSSGDYSVVLPGPGRYLVLANAQGWTPRAEILQFPDANTRQHITLTDQLTLSGTISRAGNHIGGALVTLSEAAGEVVGSVRADGAGRYCMPLPGAGRYIVTMLEPDERHAYARKVVLDVRSAVVDIEAPALPGSESL